MLAFDGVGEDGLLEGAERRALPNIDTVNRAFLRRVTDAYIGVARGGRCRIGRRRSSGRLRDEISLPIIEIEAIVVAHFIVGEGGENGA